MRQRPSSTQGSKYLPSGGKNLPTPALHRSCIMGDHVLLGLHIGDAVRTTLLFTYAQWSKTSQVPPFCSTGTGCLWQSQRIRAASLSSFDKLIYYLSTSACLSEEVRWPPLVHLCGGKHHTEISSVTAISQMGKDAAPGC